MKRFYGWVRAIYLQNLRLQETLNNLTENPLAKLHNNDKCFSYLQMCILNSLTLCDQQNKQALI